MQSVGLRSARRAGCGGLFALRVTRRGHLEAWRLRGLEAWKKKGTVHPKTHVGSILAGFWALLGPQDSPKTSQNPFKID